jgi:tRNA(His) 5'-end guanylyltransferase
MKFDDLDKKLWLYEAAHYLCVLPEIYIVARIDGRSFTKLTKQKHEFKASFDDTFGVNKGKTPNSTHTLKTVYAASPGLEPGLF